MFAGNFAFCQGQVLPIDQNTALFSLLGTTLEMAEGLLCCHDRTRCGLDSLPLLRKVARLLYPQLRNDETFPTLDQTPSCRNFCGVVM